MGTTLETTPSIKAFRMAKNAKDNSFVLVDIKYGEGSQETHSNPNAKHWINFCVKRERKKTYCEK